MRPQAAAVGLSAAVLAVAVGALSVARGGMPRELPPSPPHVAPAKVAPREQEPVDVSALRDVFRFADELPHEAAIAPGVRARPSPAAAPAPAGPRLVGILRQSGRLVAALALDGDVELAGPGESAAGVTVVSVSEDGVTIRRRDGGETTLLLPD